MGKKVFIVGGVAGGASAAARLRRLDETVEIVMFERDAYISFANCGLPYYIGDTIQDRAKLLVQTPAAMHERFNIDVRTESEVTSIDPVRKVVQVRSKERGDYEESYDALILSPGAKPIRPRIPGINHKQIYTLRNIPDTDRIKQRVTAEEVKSAIVVGAGFIGVEMAENLRELGLDVTLVEGASQILAPFDPEMSHVLAQEMEEHGVRLLLSQTVQSFTEDDHGQVEVALSGGTVVAADMVILAIGVAPDTSFLESSGIELGPRGHIVVSDKMETNLPDVYAVGDAIEVVDFVNENKTAIPLAGPANKQGRIAADNVCGLGTTYKGSQGTSIIKVFGLTGAATGNNERTLKQHNIPYQVTIVHPNTHAAYYPGATPMTIKLLFNDEGSILGAQAVGFDGVDKRIDGIATVIRLRGTVADLTELELAYAPPYSSAKDPINMVGYTAENIVTGRTNVFTVDELSARNLETTMLVDVRTALEHTKGHLSGSINLPIDELRSRLDELDTAKEIWVYCQVGLRGYTASRILQQKGFRVRNLTGGYKTYQQAQYKPGHSFEPSSHETAEAEVAATTMAPRSSDDGIHAVDKQLDVCGLSCPGPLVQVKRAVDQLESGQVLHVTATDPGFYEDIQAWAAMSSHQVLSVNKLAGGAIEAHIKKDAGSERTSPGNTDTRAPVSQRSTMVVFSGDLDKAIASFIIANGAAASGKKVTMFFTFWGLNIIRKAENIPVKKSMIGRMFSAMMPRGSRKLGLSKMNMFGMGSKMIRGIMKSNNVPSLEELIATAIEQEVELVACQMSMELMGIQEEELIDGVKFAGVGYYLGEANQSGHNLFI